MNAQTKLPVAQMRVDDLRTSAGERRTVVSDPARADAPRPKVAAARMVTSRRLVFNTFFNVVTAVSNALVAFLVVRVFLGHLGEARYGIWVLVGSVFRYRYVLSLGLSSAVNRYIPLYVAQGDEEGIARVINTGLLFFSCLAAILTAGTAVIHLKMGDWFALDADLVPTAALVVLIVGFGSAIGAPLQLGSAALSGLQRYDISGVISLIALIARTTVAIVLLQRGFGLLMLGFVFSVSEVVSQLTECCIAKRLLQNVTFSFRKVDLSLLGHMLGYGINTFLYMTSALIIYKASNLVIGVFLGAADVSRFDVACTGVVLMMQFLYALTAAIKPAVSDLDARDDRQRVKEIAFLTQKYSLLFLIPASCFLIVMGREFLTVWVGDRFGDPAVIASLAQVLAIMAVAYCLRLAQHSNFLVLVGRGQHRVFGVLTAAMAVLCVCGSVFAVRVLDAGLVGIAYANLVPMAIVCGLVLPLYFNRKMQMSVSESVVRVWHPAILGALPGVVVITLWKLVAPPDSWVGILAVVAVVAAAAVVFGWLFGLEPIERERVIRALGRRGGSLASRAAI